MAAVHGAFSSGQDWADDPKFSHFVNQGGTLHPQSLGCSVLAAYDPVAQLESTDDVIPLHFLKACHGQIGHS